MAKRKTYDVMVRYEYEGYFRVKAESKVGAEFIVQNDCGHVQGEGPHSNNDEDVIDWEFPLHPEPDIFEITRVKKNTKQSNYGFSKKDAE